MPQSDLETLACGLGGEGRVYYDPDPEPDPNLPPESVTLPVDHSAVAAWLEQAASAVYDRDDSAKESTNPKSNANSGGGGSNGNSNPKNSRSNSQRYSSGTNLKAEGPIIGLPARIRHVSCSVSRRPPGQLSTTSRIFPKRSRGKGKSLPEAEPTSPKVSCFGKVLSDRERAPRSDLGNKKKLGFWSVLATLFLCSGGGRKEAEVTSGKSTYNDEKKKKTAVEVVPTEVAAPGLGGMKRFASGRRPASWGGEGDVDVEAESEGFSWGRRSVGTIEEGRRD